MAPHSVGAHLGWAVRGAGDSEKTKEEASEMLEVIREKLPRRRPTVLLSLQGGEPWVVEQPLVSGGGLGRSVIVYGGWSGNGLLKLSKRLVRKRRESPREVHRAPSVSPRCSRFDAHLRLQLLSGSREFLHEGLIELGKARRDPSNDQVRVYVLFV
ncbi:hypothetical protein BHE74_00015402 [Ensete ventricosum]|nr:hypothetical protein BHE74_00015402 [Ensete ventricosum]